MMNNNTITAIPKYDDGRRMGGIIWPGDLLLVIIMILLTLLMLQVKSQKRIIVIIYNGPQHL
jgi:hypothetical protein